MSAPYRRESPRPLRAAPAAPVPSSAAAAPPPNVIPFTKPRAIAAIAASNPGAVVTRPATPGLQTPVNTGWTPPHAVKAIAQPASERPAPMPPLPIAPPPITPLPAPMVTPMPPPPPAPPPRAGRWAIYERLGLGAPKLDSQKAAKLIVNAYRLLGFAILTIIVVVLVGYIASSVFYYFSDSWVVPMAVSPTDEKVVSLQAQLAEQENARDRLADELGQAERAILAQQRFQAEFAKAIRSDLEGRRLALGRIQALAAAASQTRAAIKSQNAAYANASRVKLSQEYAAGLIDRTGMLSGRFQIAQITNTNLTLAERQAEFETRAAELLAQTRSLDAILASAGADNAGTPLSYEVLRIKQEYEASRLDLAKAIEAAGTLKAALARQDKIVGALQRSAYLRAVADRASVVFVPYGNLDSVEQGTSLYACKLGMIFCYHVGEILEVLPGEVQFKHPHRDKNLRGQMAVLKLDPDDADAAADDVLFAGGRPILF